jgi:hypothetical protein
MLASLRKSLLAAAILVPMVLLVFSVLAVAPVVAQDTAPQTASSSADNPKFAAFVFDVASIKLRTDDSRQFSWVPIDKNEGVVKAHSKAAMLCSTAWISEG